MCTVTWIRSAAGYELLFNRDELLERREALTPRVHERDGVRFLAPVDGDFGGSWIAVNELGSTVGILNGYRSADEDERPYRSRGLLLVDLATAGDPDSVESELTSRDLEQYRSFRLFALAPQRPARVFEWDLCRLAIDPDADARVPLISSSFEATDVGEARRAEFRRIARGDSLSIEQLLSYHRSHTNGPSAYSVCMHRDNAATRSFTRVRVDRGEVSLKYHPGTPCADAVGEEIRLSRR